MIKKSILAMLALFSSPSFAAWSYKELRDPITDQTRGIASTSVDDTSLTVKCDGSQPRSVYVQIHFSKYIGRGLKAFRSVEYRVDKNQPQIATAYHNDNFVLFMNGPLGNDRDKILSGIAAGSKFAIRVTTFEGQQLTSVIDIDGGREVIEKVIAACGDTSAPTF